MLLKKKLSYTNNTINNNNNNNNTINLASDMNTDSDRTVQINQSKITG